MRVTICIPTIRPSTLPMAIESICRQTHVDWELVVVGQGTDPGMREVTEAFAMRDRRVRYLHLEQRGVSAARNAVLRSATTDLVAFTDDDCEAEPDWLERIAEVLADERVGMVTGSMLAPPPVGSGPAVIPQSLPIPFVYDPLGTGSATMPPEWHWGAGNFAVRLSRAAKVGWFDEQMGPGTRFPSGEDTDLGVRMLEGKVKIVSSERIVVQHSGGWRYGLREIFAHRRAYSLGYGALVAKWELGGKDVTQFVHFTTRGAPLKALRGGRPLQFITSVLRAWFFLSAYRFCLKNFTYDHGLGCLRPLAQPV